jgi:transcriptional regulator with XRE-family HTH domain
VAGTTGARIRKLREKQNVTQQALAERAGMSISFLSDIENDKRNPSGRLLLSVATALGTTTDYLLQGIEPNLPVQRASPTTIPSELAAAAERAGLSYRATVTVYDAYRQIVARRGSEPERQPSADEWLAMYLALKKYIEE